jgi:ankyrin repeat protein
MDNRYSNLKLMELWYIRKNYGADKFWHSYLAYRVQNETDPEVGRFVEIRKVAEDICRQTEAEYDATANTLCWLALERGTCYPGYQWGWKSSSYRADEASNPGLNLLSAAAYLGYIPLAKRLLSDGHCPTADNDLFPSPMQLAAWAGNADMLRLFQEHLPEFEEIPPRFDFDDRTWRGKTGPGSIKGAVLRGDMDKVCLAVYPPSRSTPDNMDFSGQPFGHVDPQSKPGSDLEAALYSVQTWEAFQYIDAFFKDSILLSDSSLLLARYAELGNVEMVQKLLDAGADIHGGPRTNRNPLVIAARYWQEDVVDLLLERGIDPHNSDMQQRGSPLVAAASGGSMAIVRKLLDACGTNVKHDDYWPLHHAVRLEHTAMVELLLELNIGSARSQSLVLGMALSNGLESMAQLLQQRGVSQL